MKLATLDEILEPVAPQLRQFERYVRGVLRTSVPLLNLVLWYVFRQRGKRVRPALVLLSAAACGGISSRSFVGAALVELLHTATLLHDDVVDKSPQRRGVPSVNALWGNTVAVLVGDYLLARGLLLAIEHREYDMLEVTSEAVRRMSAAELQHLQLNRKLRLDEETYLEVVRGKTAALFAACCELGALSAGAEGELRQQLRAYGEAVGIAFQLRDDALDYLGSGQLWGKPRWKDLRERKLTLPIVVALKRMGSGERRHFLQVWKAAVRSRASLEPIARYVLQHGGVEYTLEQAQLYAERARQALHGLPPSSAREALEEFVDFAVHRTW